ncbi:MAG: hypothetical protein CR982_03070 [Candidatus Cloacimonadota bacterium]|nr:MAG: hypothetical protein CR982_03070 [Candidatus Cloacimonadota bacterium]PIE82045.1 MAG: hypothetical protein CSA15_00260 [Candidatus Delongbacteria bacterium]
MKYILTGGGSGGHIYPSLAIADKIKEKEVDAKFLYIGVKGRIEKDIVPKSGYDLKLVHAKGFLGRKISLEFFKFVFFNLLGTISSIFIVARFKPDIVIGSGGFGSAPVVFATMFMKKIFRYKTKIFLFEANAEPGKMVEFTGKFADGVGTVYEKCTRFFPKNSKHVGYPVRDLFQKDGSNIGKDDNVIPKDRFKILVFGGSQGSKLLNESVVKLLKYAEKENIFIIHATGKDNNQYKAYSETLSMVEKLGIDSEKLKKYYLIHSYLENIDYYYKKSDLIISRAGAGTIAEIAVTQRPSILVPLSGAAGDHQVLNAMYLKSINAADVVFEEIDFKSGNRVVSISALLDKIRGFRDDEDKREQVVLNSGKTIENLGTESIYLYIKSIMKDRCFNPENGEISQIKYKKNSKESNSIEDFDMSYTRLTSGGFLKMISREKVVRESSLLGVYTNYKIDLYLTSPNWRVRNNGVKIISQLAKSEYIEKLSYLFNDRRKAKLSHRLLGGDFIQVGFIRRNIIIAYRRIGVFNDIVERDLKLALSDPYFEVVSESLKTLSFFSNEIKKNFGICELVRNTLFRKELEIIIEAINTFGFLIKSVEEYSILKRFYYHKSSKVRESVIASLKRMYVSKIVDREFVKNELDNILITSSDFIPMFSIKNIIKDI